MQHVLSAIARMPASLWVVASCGVLAGAMVAQSAKGPAASPAAPAPPAAQVAAAPSAAPPVHGTPLRLLDSRPAVQSAAAATAPHEPAGGGGTVVILVLLLVAGGAAAFFIKRNNKPAAPSKRGDTTLKVVNSVRVAGRWQVALVQVPGKTLVLGATDKGLSLLTTLEPDEDLDAFELPEQTTEMPVNTALPVVRPPMPTRTPRPSTPGGPDAFLGKLLDELQTAPAAAVSPVRERPLTPSAEALRQRLERYQRKVG